MKRLSLAALTVFSLAVLGLGATAASAADPVTIGQTLPGSIVCDQYWFIQTSPESYVVPTGNWTITSWSTYAGAAGGSMALMVFRPTGSGTYEVVGESRLEPLTPNSLNTFALDSPISVHGGDLIGMYEESANCGVEEVSGVPVTGVVVGGLAPMPAVGATVTTTWTNLAFQANISVTLGPPLPTAMAECKKGGWESFGVFKNQGDCVSYVATGGRNQPGGG